MLADQLGLFWTGIDYGSAVTTDITPIAAPKPQLDKALYDQLMNELANNPVPKVASTTAATSTISLSATSTSLQSTVVTILGRGLSTGAELEYADGETIKNALRNRR